DWDLGPGATLDSAALLQDYRDKAKSKGPGIAAQKGDAEAALATAAKRVVAEYDVPYLAHATMEPLNCAVRLADGACEIWTGTQFQTMDQMSAARIAGVPQENVSIHTQFLGGGFGRRATPASDFVSEAVHVAKAAGVPVKTVWTREDDIRGGYYRPMFLHRIEVGLDDKGRPFAWKHTIVGQSILAGDPLDYRAALLADKPRHLRALKTAAEKAGWGKAPLKGRGRGLAVHESFGSIIAQAAEVSVDEHKEIHVHKVTCAVDCGTAINPLGVEAQVQGAVAFGLSAVLQSEVTLQDGRVEQSNFDDYQVLR